MAPQEIQDTFLAIKGKLKMGQIQSSINHLEQFLADLGDSDELDKLDSELITLSASFNALARQEVMGVILEKEFETAKEKIISRLVSILKETKRIATA